MAIEFKDKITFYDVDKDGDVEIEIISALGENVNVYLTQREIKEVIEFLEKQITNP